MMITVGAAITLAVAVLLVVLRPTKGKPSTLSDLAAVTLALVISCTLASGIGLMLAGLWS